MILPRGIQSVISFPVMTLFMMFASILCPSQVNAEDILIRIVGRGGAARYLGPGQTVQTDMKEAVKVTIGDKIVWQNEGDVIHTATANDSTGKLVFDTKDIPHNSSRPPFFKSKPVEITKDMFSAAGGTAGGVATIEYFCDRHARMVGRLEVRESEPSSSSETSNNARAANSGVASRLRRDITTLSSSELNAYRDMWRRIQTNGDFNLIAGYHGCPRYLCHSDESIFFPWHREYLIRLEGVLNGPVHYWDWTAPLAATSGIPVAFTASSYRSSDGRVYPNPLFSTRFQCPSTNPGRSTFRRPRNPSFLRSYGADVRSAYSLFEFSRFSDAINFGPHGSLHTWVSGDMGNTTYAAYDPIFWAHHSNIDRQWVSWQLSGKPDPLLSTLTKALPGFAPKTVADVIDFKLLGYEYDRLDKASLNFASASQVDMHQGVTQSGVGRSYSVTPATSAPRPPVSAAGSRVQLIVNGIDAHPRQSLFVYVFGNQPDASVEDATPDNPRFLGTFGIFGGSGDPIPHDGIKERRVMTLPAGFEELIGSPITQVTLVVVDENDTIILPEQIPIESIRLNVIDSTDAASRASSGQTRIPPSTPGWKVFKGISDRESYDEAYKNAVDQAMADLGTTPDARIETQVESVEGTRGGITGSQSLTVTIRARRR